MHKSDRPTEAQFLARHVLQARINSGRDQAILVAASLAQDFGYLPEDLLRLADDAEPLPWGG